ncbi:MAG: peroxiredoxin, partial [Flavobacteriales bacterium]
CVPCLQELPHLNGFYEVYQDDGLVVLAITTDGPETQSDVRSLVRRSRWSLEVLSDMDGAVSNVLNPRGTNPFTLYIDRAGRVAASHEGYSLGDEVMAEQYIQTLLAETL